MISFFEMCQIMEESKLNEAGPETSVDFQGMANPGGIDRSHGTGGKFTRDKVVDPGAHLDRKLYGPDKGFARDRAPRQDVSYVGDHRGELSRQMGQNPAAILALKFDEQLPKLADRSYASAQELAMKLLATIQSTDPDWAGKPINAANAQEGINALTMLMQKAPHLFQKDKNGGITVVRQGNPHDTEHEKSTGRYSHQKVNPKGGVGDTLSKSQESNDLASIFKQMKDMKAQIELMNFKPEYADQLLGMAEKLHKLSKSANPDTASTASRMLAAAEGYMDKLDQLAKYQK